MKTTRTLIGEASRRTSICPTALRKLDRRGVLKPRRDYTGRRVYSDADISRLRELAGLDPEEN